MLQLETLCLTKLPSPHPCPSAPLTVRLPIHPRGLTTTLPTPGTLTLALEPHGIDQRDRLLVLGLREYIAFHTLPISTLYLSSYTRALARCASVPLPSFYRQDGRPIKLLHTPQRGGLVECHPTLPNRSPHTLDRISNSIRGRHISLHPLPHVLASHHCPCYPRLSLPLIQPHPAGDLSQVISPVHLHHQTP